MSVFREGIAQVVFGLRVIEGIRRPSNGWAPVSFALRKVWG